MQRNFSGDFCTKDINIDGLAIQLCIYDTAGQERFQSLGSSYYRNAHGAIVVYDITNKTSFQNVLQWMHAVDENGPKIIQKVLVGNKTDLDNLRQVETEEALIFADKWKLELIETSAKLPTNVDELFQQMARSIKLMLDD
uniref:Uncharacterized protein n=1 Tax=Arcella intermedia TaxID=1963864 RepID=A0A6B2LM08_9EUKA